jgi:hypothetical protein
MSRSLAYLLRVAAPAAAYCAAFWPGVALGAFLANAWNPVLLPAATGITEGNTLEALDAAYLVRRVADALAASR